MIQFCSMIWIGLLTRRHKRSLLKEAGCAAGLPTKPCSRICGRIFGEWIRIRRQQGLNCCSVDQSPLLRRQYALCLVWRSSSSSLQGEWSCTQSRLFELQCGSTVSAGLGPSSPSAAAGVIHQVKGQHSQGNLDPSNAAGQLHGDPDFHFQGRLGTWFKVLWGLIGLI